MGYFEASWSLRGKRAVVTGAGRGIGRCIAQALSAAGAEVLVHFYNSEDAAGETVEAIAGSGGDAWSARADLTDSDQVSALFSEIDARWGSLDILVNNAGSLIDRCRVEDLSDDLIESVIRTNFHTALYCCRAAIPLLRKGSLPSIVNISSIAAHNGGADGSTLYAAMKGALVSFTRGLAKELGPEVRVNAVAPAAVLTDFLKENISRQRLERITEATPMSRLGRGEDTAAAVVFLCGAGSSYITGELIDVSGGRKLAF